MPTGASVGQMASFQSVGSETKKVGGYAAAVPKKKTKPKSSENASMLMKAMLLGTCVALLNLIFY